MQLDEELKQQLLNLIKEGKKLYKLIGPEEALKEIAEG